MQNRKPESCRGERAKPEMDGRRREEEEDWVGMQQREKLRMRWGGGGVDKKRDRAE